MWKMKIFVVVCMLYLSFFNRSDSDASEPVNVIVILDTSDRISRNAQVGADVEIVAEIVAKFDKLVQKYLKKIPVGENVQYPHRLSFVVPDQPNTPAIPPKIMRKLELWDQGTENVYDEFVKQRDALLGEIPKLYDYVGQHKQTGSDIWDWFQSEAQDYFYKGYQNLIICISDGYLIFDDHIQLNRLEGTCMHLIDGKRIDMSKGLSPVKPGCSDYIVKFLMLEIDMKDPGDYENMKKYWKRWLNAIGIQETDFAKKGRWLRKIQTFIPAE